MNSGCLRAAQPNEVKQIRQAGFILLWVGVSYDKISVMVELIHS